MGMQLKRGGPVRSLLTVVLGCAWVFAGFRNLPRLSHPSAAAVGLVVGVCLLLAYRAGRRSVSDSAIASAVARAEASALAAARSRAESSSAAQANVFVNLDPAQGARAAGAATGLDSAPWLVGAHRRAEVEDSEAVELALEDVHGLEVER